MITEMAERGVSLFCLRISSATDTMYKLDLPFHQKIVKEELPYTIGGGIGISRILMLLLEMKHISLVQASSWDSKTIKDFKDYML